MDAPSRMDSIANNRQAQEKSIVWIDDLATVVYFRLDVLEMGF